MNEESDLFSISILGPLPIQKVKSIEELPVQQECIFTQEPDIEDDDYFIPAQQEYKLQIRGQYLVECVPKKNTIIGGIKFSTAYKYEIKRLFFNDCEELGKPFAFILYFPFEQENNCSDEISSENEDDQIVIKLGIQINKHESLQKFVTCLQTKKLIQINCHNCYKIVQRLCRTLNSCIYLAQRLKDNLKVVIKTVIKQRTQMNKMSIAQKTVIKEFQMLREVDNKRICKVYSLFEAENSLFLVMQSLSLNLLQFIQKRGFKSAEEFRNTIQKILEGVKHLLEKNIMHRDLKLQNIMMREVECEKFEPVIIDFGLAEYEGVLPYTFKSCGTPGYAAPEVINCQTADPQYTKKCDVFSLGCIFYCLLLRKSLFEGSKVEQVINKNKECNIDESQQIYNFIEPNAKDLLFRMLKKNPQERITIEEALNHNFFKNEVLQNYPKEPIKFNNPSIKEKM